MIRNNKPKLRIGVIMGKILVEKLSYTEVNKNISQTEYEKIQEEYLLSRSPEKYCKHARKSFDV